MFRIESLISPFLLSYLNRYVVLRQSDFQLSLWGGDLRLANLELRHEVIFSFGRHGST